MRDFSVDWLQAFLRDNNVQFETQPSPEQLEAAQKAGGDGEEGEAEAGEAEGDGEEAPAQAEGTPEKNLKHWHGWYLLESNTKLCFNGEF